MFPSLSCRLLMESTSTMEHPISARGSTEKESERTKEPEEQRTKKI